MLLHHSGHGGVAPGHEGEPGVPRGEPKGKGLRSDWEASIRACVGVAQKKTEVPAAAQLDLALPCAPTGRESGWGGWEMTGERQAQDPALGTGAGIRAGAGWE